jgi:hypothetical protein
MIVTVLALSSGKAYSSVESWPEKPLFGMGCHTSYSLVGSMKAFQHFRSQWWGNENSPTVTWYTIYIVEVISHGPENLQMIWEFLFADGKSIGDLCG